ncbi:MAG: hypothetical protein LUQ65_07090, partial [Candidatus Helarchaeota archaeon]|nr:hypothetical protein [Candidatus Helarchaeota archaeon]
MAHPEHLFSFIFMKFPVPSTHSTPGNLLEVLTILYSSRYGTENVLGSALSINAISFLLNLLRKGSNNLISLRYMGSNFGNILDKNGLANSDREINELEYNFLNLETIFNP